MAQMVGFEAMTHHAGAKDKRGELFCGMDIRGVVAVIGMGRHGGRLLGTKR